MKYITKEMIEDGLMSKVIIPKLEEDGLVCYIGDYWFFFGGSEFEYTNPKDIPFSVLVNEIKEVLDDFYKHPEMFEYEHFCKSREEYDETYLVCESVKPNPATTKFLDRVYGTCGHESLPYIYDDANTDAKLKPGVKYYYKVEAI